MSQIKIIDMSTVGTDQLTRINKVLEAVFGITIEEKKTQNITLFGELVVQLYMGYNTQPTLYDKSGKNNILDLCTDSSTVYYVVGDNYVSIWGSNLSSDYKYYNCIVKISENIYHFARSKYAAFCSLKDGTTYSVSGTWPSLGGDSFLEGVVIPLYCISSIAGNSFVSDRCYWVTRAGELLPIGSEVTVGEETYIILTQGSNGITYSGSTVNFQLAAKKK